MTKNQIEYWKNQYSKQAAEREAAETHRTNLAREKETARANMVAEEIQRKQAAIAAQQARAALSQAASQAYKVRADYQLANKQLGETGRANRANEAIKSSSIAQSERDSVRRNVQSTYSNTTSRLAQMANERAQAANINIGLSTLGEQHRSNLANESNRSRQNAIQAQYNAQQVNLRNRELLEKKRANRAQESIARSGQMVNLVSNLSNSLSRIALVGGKLR